MASCVEKEDHLLISSHGKSYTTRALQKHFKSALKIVGLSEHYSIHSARHSYATHLYSTTKDLRLTGQILNQQTV